MKIAWFTPFTRKSAIGKISALICEELAKNHEVEVWTQHREELIATTVPVVSFAQDGLEERLRDYDVVFYNFGNFAGYHREIMDAAQKVPGIIILHDQTMADFWGQYYCIREFGGDGEHGIEPYREMVERYYGPQAVRAVDEAVQSGLYPFYAHSSLNGYSFLEPTAACAQGIFTHSRFFAKRLQTLSNKPVGYSYLPCSLPDKPTKSTELDQLIDQAKRQGRKILVSSGIVHPVKRIDKIAQCLCRHPELAEKICYLVVGGCDGPFGESLKELEQGELKGCLHMLGYRPDAEMEAALYAADMAVNLRYPNSEVCSLSLWEQMAYGKPVLVLNSGIYGEVPEDVVVRITLEKEQEGLERALTELVNGQLDSKLGQRARAFVREQCDVSVYCKHILEFAQTVRVDAKVAALQQRVIADVAQKMSALRLTEASAPASYAAVVDQIAKVFGSRQPDGGSHTMGIWVGFPYHVPNLNREGVSRLMGYLVSSMLHYYPDVNAEIWCYSFNEEEARITFASVQEEDAGRIRFITEKNWAEQLGATPAQVQAVGPVSEREDNLICAAREASKASMFIPLILYLDRVTESGKRIFVPGYDMGVAEHYEDFVKKDPLYMARNLDYIWRAENMAARNGVFFSNSDTVRNSEILKYIRGLKEQLSHTIYIPPNIPKLLENDLPSEKALRKKYGIEGRYLFYPTQIRPYKNVDTLVRALALLAEDYPDLKLILTGTPTDVPDVEQALQETGMYARTLLIKNVPEAELYGLYHYAQAVPVTSVMEGGFHYQAMEGLFQSAPVIVADIPVVRERIESLGYDVESSGMLLFDPFQPEALAKEIRRALEDREGTVQRQHGFADKLMSYTWKEAIVHYYELFFGAEKRRTNAKI